MKTLMALFLLISLTTYGQTAKKEREGEPDIYGVGEEDKQMNEAIKKARLTFSDFLNTFQKSKLTQTNFTVKMAFKSSLGAEHIWLVNLESKDGKLFGYINNVPDDVVGIRFGDRVEILSERISDWFYIENNKLVGGFTIRVLRNRMTPAERKQFDLDFGVQVD